MESIVKYQKFVCPCCGYDGLDTKPYKDIPNPPYPINLTPPYSNHWGEGSYDVCLCCGFEYGLDDEPGPGLKPDSFESYLKNWVQNESCKWFEPKSKPTDWDIVKQLEAAGISVPEYIRLARQLTGKK
ncbi:MAG: hypothetical protein A2Z20_02535 [Bdellovibrionales bacterium RBG_16_40_8]|nr:MAG: hypothetical protein A2Z20_02535 [Bdellovibrionales bacterium RBG_16_40_8]